MNTQELEKVNHNTIAMLFNDSMSILYPNGIKYENVLLFITDAASYMIKAAEGIKITFGKMTHLTCMNHALNRLSEKIRSLNPKTNKLISNVKKVFMKSPSRIAKFKEVAPDLKLPPQPIITCWATWLKAANYYAINFDVIKEIVCSFDKEEALSIDLSQKCLNDERVRSELIFIHANYGFLIELIKKLETRNLILNDSIKLVNEAVEKVTQVPSQKGEAIKEKLNYILNKNKGFEKLVKINQILNGESQMNLKYSIEEMSAFKYAPITSCEAERSFSVFKSILSEKRTSFNFENLKMYLFVNSN